MLNFKKVTKDFKSYPKEIKEILESLLPYDPEKVILFGSAAQGKLKKGGDVDLLVIKETNEPYWERQLRVTKMYPGFIPTDIFVLTPREFERAKKENRFFLTEEILPKGKVIYEKKSH